MYMFVTLYELRALYLHQGILHWVLLKATGRQDLHRLDVEISRLSIFLVL
jgi:hypothetical protein